MSFGQTFDALLYLLGMAGGLYWFVKGLARYRAYRFLADTPEVPIRSMPMGLVHFHGKAWAEKPLPSPVTHTSCLFYKVEIEQWDESNSSWRPYMTDCNGVEFYLQDQTGRVKVDAQGASFDLPRSIRCRTGQVAWLGGFVDLARNWKSLTAAHSLPATDEDLRAYVGSLSPPGGGDYRLTEFCILPAHWYDVIGTCAENPNPQNPADHNLIVKGENDPTYLISYRSGPSLETSLRSRAMRYIFAGAGFAILCLGLILSTLGWL